MPRIALDWIDEAVKPGVLASRFLIMPPVERHLGPVAFYPPNAEVEKLMALVGTPVPLREKRDLLTIWSLTALLAPFFNFVATTADWAAKNGVDPETARAYAVSMFESIAVVAVSTAAPSTRSVIAPAPEFWTSNVCAEPDGRSIPA